MMEDDKTVGAMDTMARSMDDTQRNATDTKGFVEQVLSMAGEETSYMKSRDNPKFFEAE